MFEKAKVNVPEADILFYQTISSTLAKCSLMFLVYCLKQSINLQYYFCIISHRKHIQILLNTESRASKEPYRALRKT